MGSINYIKRIDDLGRIVIPKEIRRILKIDENENMKIELNNDEIIIKKHNSLNDYQKEITNYAVLVNQITKKNILVINRDEIIYSSNNIKNKEISEELRRIIINRNELDNEYKLDICYDIKIKSFYYSKNLIKNSNLLGTIIIYSEDRISDEEKELINTVSTLFNS